MKNSKVLITGASGCVGQHIAYWLLENSNADLILWLRDPSKLTAIDPSNPRVKLIVGDLRQPSLFSEELSTVTRLIHTATAWGDPNRAYEVNVLAVQKLFNELNPNLIEQIIYFSTASILKHNLSPLPEAFRYGTEYIKTKAQCLKELEEHPLSKKIIAVFPTLVFSGRLDKKSKFPTSYLTSGLLEATKWLWLARWIRVFSRFHFIHAADIAFICGHLATNPHNYDLKTPPTSIRKMVLGQESISINQTIIDLIKWRRMIITPSIPLSNWIIELLVRILPLEINNWDKFSIKQRNFTHNPVISPENYGTRSYAKTLDQVFNVSGLPRSNKPKRS